VTGVRLATREDLGSIARLRRMWTEENAGGAIADDTFDGRFEEWFQREHDQRLTWLGFTPGTDQPVGMLNLLVFTRMPAPVVQGAQRPTRWGYLANCFVLAGHRNTGLGARLLAACTTYADEHEFARVVLSPTERSIPFYARAGFEPATSLMARPGPLQA
jgi:GNAT superfamily N-acetyltransferase